MGQLTVVLLLAVGAYAANALDADQVFQHCCRRQRKVVDGCLPFCTYQPTGFSQTALDVMYYDRDAKCPRRALGSYLFCSGSGMDHREGCKRNGVGEPADGLCLELCNLRDGVTLTLTLGHLPCLGVLPKVRQTFREQVERDIADGRYNHMRQAPTPQNFFLPEVRNN